MKIKNNIFIMLVLLSIIPILVLGIYFARSSDSRIEEIMEENLKIACSVQKQNMENFFAEREMNMKIISDTEMVHIMLQGQADEELIQNGRYYLDDLLSQWVNNSTYAESITVTDKNFRIIGCSTQYESEVTLELKEANQKFHTGEFAISNILDTNAFGNKKEAIACVMGIYEQDELIGYIVEEINTSFFESLRLEADMWEGGTLYLLDGNSRMITAGNNQEESRQEFVLPQEERDVFNEKWISMDLEKEPSGNLQYKIGGNTYITSYSTIDRTEWVIMESVSLTDFQVSQKYYRIIALTVILLVSIVLLAANYLVSKKIILPVDQIKNYLTLTEQKQDYSLRIPIKQKDEIGLISQQINHLLAYIEKAVSYERERAQKDSLTGVYNNKNCYRILHETAVRTAAEGKPMACIFIDLDNFKDYNTDYGHAMGDKVLIFTAKVLQGIMGDNVGRLGGDEFFVCTDDEEKIERLEQLLWAVIESLNTGLVEESGLLKISCSVGAVISRSGALSGEELLKQADEIMYMVKNKGKNHYQIAEV